MKQNMMGMMFGPFMSMMGMSMDNGPWVVMFMCFMYNWMMGKNRRHTQFMMMSMFAVCAGVSADIRNEFAWWYMLNEMMAWMEMEMPPMVKNMMGNMNSVFETLIFLNA